MTGKPPRLLIATTNAGKIAELRRMLEGTDGELLDLTAYPAAPAVEETGQTFLANAALKAGAYARHTRLWTLADDSGLSVDALNGAPGVHSARYAQMHGHGEGDAANNALLLQQLENVPQEKRTARFICTLALADPQGAIVLTATDWVAGQILSQSRGSGGFGYDPLFLVPRLTRTTAELMPGEKNAISHRGKALRRMLALMARCGFGQASA